MDKSISDEEREILIVKRKDILDTIAKNITDREILDDIIEHVESKIASKASNLIPVVIPQVGAIIPNVNKIDALDNNEFLNEMKARKSPEAYKIFNKEFIRERFKQRGKYRTRTTLIKYAIRSNKKRATRLLRKPVSEEYLNLYFYFFAHLKQISNNYE